MQNTLFAFSRGGHPLSGGSKQKNAPPEEIDVFSKNSPSHRISYLKSIALPLFFLKEFD
jgi:hypothetical protein